MSNFTFRWTPLGVACGEGFEDLAIYMTTHHLGDPFRIYGIDDSPILRNLREIVTAEENALADDTEADLQ